MTYAGLALLALLQSACTIPGELTKHQTEKRSLPQQYTAPSDSVNTGTMRWRSFFTDPNLVALIDTALSNNQELNVMVQEMHLAEYEIRARKGEYLPFVNLQGGAGVERTARYTRQGAVDANTEIKPGQKIPDPLPDYLLMATASWEVDIWKKLRNAKKAALHRYLATSEGKNFMVTHLIAEVAHAYYELMALDNQLEILRQNIQIQQNALEIVKMEKQAARTTELAVRRFEAEVLKNQSRQFYIQQRIVETENHINFLTGRFPQPVRRNSSAFNALPSDSIHAGLPSQLLLNRPDIRRAEQQLLAAKLDVKSARANFYPSLRLVGGIGLQAFKPQYLMQTPESMLYTAAGELIAPLVNRNAIKAYYYSATARQIQQVYDYERTVLNAYIEVVNQLSNINNLKKSYDLQAQQVQALTQSIDISTRLFKSARADYMEVLLTQRDALESRFELIETRKLQLNAMVNVYQQLGGGWN